MLLRYPSGEERCIACKLCEAICPAQVQSHFKIQPITPTCRIVCMLKTNKIVNVLECKNGKHTLPYIVKQRIQYQSLLMFLFVLQPMVSLSRLSP